MNDSLPDERTIRIKRLVSQFVADRDEWNANAANRLVSSFPELAPDLKDHLDAARVMMALRKEAPAADISTIHHGPPQDTIRLAPHSLRCPECHSELPESPTPHLQASISCSSCGQSFRIENTPAKLRSLQAGMSIGRFELMEQLGRGGFGVVWKAHDPQLERLVAIKIPRRIDLTADEADQFLREARAASHVRHRNVVTVHEVGHDEEILYIVSDFIDGHSLSDQLDHEQTMSPREAAELTATICQALQAIHDKGIIHRDLKPDNVLINRQGVPFVTDFGLAKRTESDITLTVDGLCIGTPAYMSPEQARGDARLADARSDVYSLGVMLFELLTGELPFRGSPQRIMDRIANSDAPSLRSLQPTVPRDLETISLRCMEKSPDKRFQSADELAAELRRYLNGEPILSRRISPLRRAVRWCYRKPLAASLIAIVSAIAAVAPLAYWHELGQRIELGRQKEEINHALKLANRREQQAQKNERLARRVAYAAHLSTSSVVWDPLTTRIRISERNWCPEEFREFAWRHAMYATDRVEKKLELHTGLIDDVAFSPDGRYLASCGRDGRLLLWDTSTWQPRVLFHDERSGWEFRNIYQVEFLPDGKQIITSNHRGEVLIWDVDSGDPIRTVTSIGSKIQNMAVSEDGKTIAITGTGIAGLGHGFFERLFLCDVETGDRRLLKGHEEYCPALDFSPDGKFLASGSSDNTLRIWQVETGDCIKTKEYDSTINTVSFSGFGDRLFVGADYNFELLKTDTWEKDNWGKSRSFDRGLFSVSDAVHFSDSTKILIGTGQTIAALHCNRGSVESMVDLEPGVIVGSVDASPDGRHIAVAVNDHSIRIHWLTSIGIFRTFQGHTAAVRSVVYAPDSRFVFSGSHDRTVIKWDFHSGFKRWIVNLGAPINRLALSPDGKLVVAALANGHIVQLDSKSGGILQEWKAHIGEATHVLVCPDGSLVSCGWDGKIAVWEQGKLRSKIDLDGRQITYLDYLPEKEWLAVARDDGIASVLSFPGGEPVKRLVHRDERVECVRFSPDGNYLATALLGEWHLWDLKTDELLHALSLKTWVGMHEFAFSADGRDLATTELMLAIWDPLTGAQLASYDEMGGSPAACVAFAPDGNSIAYGRANGHVYIRDAVPAGED